MLQSNIQEDIVISELAEILKKPTIESQEVTSLLFKFFGNILMIQNSFNSRFII